MLNPWANISVLPGGEPAGDVALVDGAGVLIRHQHHDDVRRRRCGRDRPYIEPRRLGPLPGGAAGAQADDHPRSAVAEVQGVGVPLAAVADDGEGAAAQPALVGVGIVVDPHWCSVMCSRFQLRFEGQLAVADSRAMVPLRATSTTSNRSRARRQESTKASEPVSSHDQAVEGLVHHRGVVELHHVEQLGVAPRRAEP